MCPTVLDGGSDVHMDPMAALKALEGDGNAELAGTVLNSPVLLGRERTPLEPQNGLWNKLVKK